MIVSDSLRVGGCTILWNLSEFTDQEAVELGLAGIGLGKFAPPRRPPVQALREAMQEVVGGARVLVRPLADKKGWAAVKELRGQQSNQYEHVLTARIDDSLQISFTPFDERAQTIVGVFNEHAGYLHAAEVSRAMVQILDSMMAISLRPRGAVYWIPDYRISDWSKVADVVERASIGRGSAVYLFRTIMDQDTVRGVRDAVVTEIRSKAEAIDREIREDELGPKALEHRQELAQDLRRKIGEYEELLGTGLESLRSLVDQTEEAAARAAVLASAVPERVA